MTKFYINSSVVVLILGLLFLFEQKSFCKMSDKNKENQFLKTAESLDWNLSIDSAGAFFKTLGCDSCKVYHRNNYLTVGPYIRCANGSVQIGCIYNWKTLGNECYQPLLYYYFVTFPDSVQCLAFFDTMKNIGYDQPSPMEQVEPLRVERVFDANTKKQFKIGICNECNSDNTLKFYKSIP